MASMNDLKQALQASYSCTGDETILKECQAYLMNTDGLLPLLIEIIQDQSNDDALKLSACIKLKNMITARWEVSDFRAKVAQGMEKLPLTIEEKQLFCFHSYSLLRSVIQVKGMRKLVVLCMRTVIDNDFTAGGEYINLLSGHIEASLQPGNLTDDVLTALAPLKLIFEFDRFSEAEITEKVLVKFYGVLLKWCSDLRSTDFFATDDTSSVVLMLVKIQTAIFKMSVPTNHEAKAALLNGNIQSIEFIRSVISQPIPNLEKYTDTEVRNALPAMKAVRYAVTCFSTVHFYRYMSKPMHTEASVDPRKEILFTSGNIDLIVNDLLVLLNKVDLYDDRVGIQILASFCNAIEQASIYSTLKCHIGGIITEVCQKWMSYDVDDVERWEEDPVEVAKADNDDWAMEPSDAAIKFVEKLCRLRAKDWLEYILAHITQVFEAVESASAEERLSTVSSANGIDAKKDGALCMLGCISPRLRHRKLPMDTVFLQHVATECQSVNPFLRKRACWVIREFLDQGYGLTADICVSEETLVVLYQSVHALMKDREVPVRSQAAVTVRVFFGICSEDGMYPNLKTAIEADFRQVVSSLFTLTNEEGLLDNEHIVESITELMHNFKDAALPYIAEIMEQLVQKLDKYIEEGEEDDIMFGSKWQTAMQLVETITTILDSMERSNNSSVFLQIEPVLAPLLYKMIGPMCDFELFEDGLSLLGNLTYSIPKFSETTWALFTLMYTSLVGGPTPKGMVFENDVKDSQGNLMEWGSGSIRHIVSVMDNYICLDANGFITGCAEFQDGTTLSYTEMIFRICGMYMKPEPEDYENKCLYCLELLALCYEGFCELDKSDIKIQANIRAFGVSTLKSSRYFLEGVKAIENSLPKNYETHLSCVVRLWSSMLMWNSTEFISMLQECELLSDVLPVLFATGRQDGDKVIYNNGLEGPRSVCLGSCFALNVAPLLPALEPFVPGIIETIVIAFRAQIAHITELMQNDEDWDCSDDSEQQLDENEDAKLTKTDNIIAKLRAQFDNDDDFADDDDFEPSTELTTRKSAVTEMDQFALLEEAVTKGHVIFVNVLGAAGLNAFKEELKTGFELVEEYKKHEAELY
eukprot:GHVH01008785.1.p1 GENE.GHVH01008785.1~~GHVH01008785.1.p1  ORF type:complete len:1124 (+),score=217.42 GHVH01008785.1:88-3372(+)